ncbi:MAG: 7-carboxy-7-deazaguanine synthase QueE [Flavobacteriales bacterium]|nr:7-carboxy-7-deazaguanine synthase QueE [Flavobacteriales bacterium]
MEATKKVLNKEGGLLPLMEAFYSIQGEGFHSGKSAYFLRIGGCDVGCHWCDVKESWDANLHPLTKVEDIIKEIDETKINTVVITGGEPLMWNMDLLCSRLKQKGIKVHLETSGAYPLSGDFDWICLSPKKNQKALDEIKPLANELKIIVQNKHDLKWAEAQKQSVSTSCKLYLQPEWSKIELVMPLITDFVMENTHWQISLQTHKYMNLP